MVVVDICDIGEKLDLEKETEPEDNGRHINPHTFGTLEWQKVEEEKILKDSVKRMDRMKNLHTSMDRIWKYNYLETEKVFNDFLPINTNDGKKPECAPPKLDKFPLNQHCEVAKYKQCVAKLTNKTFETNE
ncbi:uncharacterized protein LOC106668401 [Cimex lectularius]|uniref:Uncharacterized protein n=1 Tax=Cimex lectularius TaxID=79782 RepID=A0A8I6RVV6_CIMLE|nr:uncharacterized protein LOC106668401 [Cimex lectularius]